MRSETHGEHRDDAPDHTEDGGPAIVPTMPDDDEPSGTDTPARNITGQTVTVADDGATVRLDLGRTATLELEPPVPSEPVVTGDAVVLLGIENVGPRPGERWEIRATQPGRSNLRAEDGTGVSLAVTIVVVEAG